MGRTGGIIWNSPDVHKQSIFLNGEYDAWIIVHYQFWIILATIFFNTVFIALLHYGTKEKGQWFKPKRRYTETITWLNSQMISIKHGVDVIHYFSQFIRVLCLWCYRYTSGIIQDHLIIPIGILNPKSWIITRISQLDQPSGSVHPLVMSPLHYLHINRPTTAIKPSANKMCIIFRLVLVVGSLLSMVYSLSAGNLIPSRRTNDSSLMLQWFIPYETRCR